jgi:hypothetical protein
VHFDFTDCEGQNRYKNCGGTRLLVSQNEAAQSLRKFFSNTSGFMPKGEARILLFYHEIPVSAKEYYWTGQSDHPLAAMYPPR